MQAKIREDIIRILIPPRTPQIQKYAKLFNDQIKYHINPTGKFVTGVHGDTGLTGRRLLWTPTEAKAPMAVELSAVQDPAS